VQAYLEVAKRAAREAGTLIRRAAGRRKTITYKGRIDPVTQVDTACERVITRLIRRRFPDHSILSEEMGAVERGSDYRWVVDPLDGTVNFAHNFPCYCTCIALACRERVIVGVIYDPQRDELFSAMRGHGAFLNARRIRVSAIQRLDRALLATGFAYNIKTAGNKNIRSFGRVAQQCQGIRRAGSAGIDLAYVACGRFDGFWEYNLKPWDVAAGSLLVQEAGGRVTAIHDDCFSIYDQQLLAAGPGLYPRLSRLLQAR